MCRRPTEAPAPRAQGAVGLGLGSPGGDVTRAGFGALLAVGVRCVAVRGARFRYGYASVRDAGALMAEGYTGHACVDAATLAPTRVPEWLRKAVAAADPG